MLGTILEPEDAAGNKTDKQPLPLGVGVVVVSGSHWRWELGKRGRVCPIGTGQRVKCC
jgi:hypothetical protein